MTEHGWLVRAGRDNELIDVYRDKSSVAIRWNQIGDLEDTDSREEIKERYRTAYPERKIERLRVDSGTLHRFVNEMLEGDLVMTYDKSTREYHIGCIAGEYLFVASDDLESHPHCRPVSWTDTIDRIGSLPRPRTPLEAY